MHTVFQIAQYIQAHTCSVARGTSVGVGFENTHFAVTGSTQHTTQNSSVGTVDGEDAEADNEAVSTFPLCKNATVVAVGGVCSTNATCIGNCKRLSTPAEGVNAIVWKAMERKTSQMWESFGGVA